jgi:hypothetical protein
MMLRRYLFKTSINGEFILNAMDLCNKVINIQRRYRARQESLRGRKEVFRKLVEREFKTLIDFYKKKMLKNKKDKKVANLFK